MSLEIIWNRAEFDEVTRRLEQFDRKVRKKVVRKLVRDSGNIVLKQLKQDVPVQSGRLKRSLKQRLKTRRWGIQSFMGAKWLDEQPETGIYGYVVEFGKKKDRSRANPFAVNAYNKVRPKMINHIRSGISNAYKEAERMTR